MRHFHGCARCTNLFPCEWGWCTGPMDPRIEERVQCRDCYDEQERDRGILEFEHGGEA